MALTVTIELTDDMVGAIRADLVTADRPAEKITDDDVAQLVQANVFHSVIEPVVGRQTQYARNRVAAAIPADLVAGLIALPQDQQDAILASVEASVAAATSSGASRA